MDSQFYIEYEIIDSVTNERQFTREHDVALACFKEGDMVYERHVTLCTTSPYHQTYMANIMPWHLNPDFQEDEDENETNFH
jgi:hypothetical protein